MPNHILNILKVHGSDESVKAVFNHIKGEEGQPIDFNKIIECPLELNIEEGFDTYTGLKAALFQLDEFNFREFKNEYDKVRQWNELRAKNALFNGKCALRNIVKYDAATWYKWRIKNWGTKWNAYDIQMIDDYTIKFDTAWSGVPSLIEVLSTMFPDVTLEYCYADEDAGCNTFRVCF